MLPVIILRVSQGFPQLSQGFPELPRIPRNLPISQAAQNLAKILGYLGLDFDNQDNEAYIQWCIDFRNAQRSLWDRERFPIEESIMVIKRKEIERYRREHKEEQEVKEEQELKEEQERKEEPKA
ncbi:hypothetical protein BT96DRAFT_948769 [Gymnopus androsaceus JB14]|uniref:Uncharacterized protein n=1 Tax=Gymnopus androsaceus JB14 TaxID=1447944 RepID=A0A6A4GMH3_9AGAR|nr:hypothetical protein BT96DRAFT_948769 [Gymnopus androsaceus JB14]